MCLAWFVFWFGTWNLLCRGHTSSLFPCVINYCWQFGSSLKYTVCSVLLISAPGSAFLPPYRHIQESARQMPGHSIHKLLLPGLISRRFCDLSILPESSAVSVSVSPYSNSRLGDSMELCGESKHTLGPPRQADRPSNILRAIPCTHYTHVTNPSPSGSLCVF